MVNLEQNIYSRLSADIERGLSAVGYDPDEFYIEYNAGAKIVYIRNRESGKMYGWSHYSEGVH